MDDRISELQFGFRAKRSTSQPLFIARRIQDYVESAGDKLTMVFLDLEKACDKICHAGLFSAMACCLLSPYLLLIVMTVITLLTQSLQITNMLVPPLKTNVYRHSSLSYTYKYLAPANCGLHNSCHPLQLR